MLELSHPRWKAYQQQYQFSFAYLVGRDAEFQHKRLQEIALGSRWPRQLGNWLPSHSTSKTWQWSRIHYWYYHSISNLAPLNTPRHGPNLMLRRNMWSMKGILWIKWQLTREPRKLIARKIARARHRMNSSPHVADCQLKFGREIVISDNWNGSLQGSSWC